MISALDTESTGLKNHPTLGHPQCIELAMINLSPDLENMRKLAEPKTASEFEAMVETFMSLGKVTRYQPSMDIDPRATEVHGIVYKDLLGFPKSESLELPKELLYLVAHNAQYDYRVLGKPKHIRCFCTLILARKLDKKFGIGFKNHKLDTLTLHFYGKQAQTLIDNSHQALTDTVKVILVLSKLLEYIPNIKTFFELYDFQELLKKLK